MTQVITNDDEAKKEYHRYIRISDIKIGNRIRKDLGDIKGLARSIRRHGGLLHPIVLTENFELVCGYRRIAAHKYLGLTEIEYTIVKNPLDPRDAEVDENNARKDFTIEEISEIDEFYREKEEAAARERQNAGRAPNPNLSENFAKGKSAAKIAALVGRSDKQLEKIRFLKTAAIVNPAHYRDFWEQANRTNKVDKPYRKAWQISIAEKAREKALKDLSPDCIPGHYELKYGLMQEKGLEIKENSIQLMITDPQYDIEHLYLYDENAKLAVRALEPRRSLFVIAPAGGPSYVYVINRTEQLGLNFQADITLRHKGQSQRVHYLNLLARKKTILWFCKGDKPIVYHDVVNLIESETPDKTTFEWAQSPEDARPIIKSMTVPYEKVLDPFCGEGNFLIAALQEDRYSIGIDNNLERINIAKAKLSKEYNKKLQRQQQEANGNGNGNAKK